MTCYSNQKVKNKESTKLLKEWVKLEDFTVP